MNTIVITGIGGRLATLVAGALAAQPRTRVNGVGETLPPAAPDGVQLQQCDMRGDSLLDLLHASAADVVLHLDNADEEPRRGRDTGGRGSGFRAIEVLGAAAGAGVPRVVLRSSTLVYGARPDAPAFIAEDAPLGHVAHPGPVRDYAEIERVAGEFAVRHPALRIASVRCAPIVGGGVSSPLARFLPRRPAPVMLGFDPRIQVLHAHDGAVALALAALAHDLAEPVNVAADPPLPLGKAIQLAGGRAMPLPGVVFAAASHAREGPLPGVEALAGALAAPVAGMLAELPFDAEFLRYACVADTRRARELIAWAPQRTSEDALRELACAAHPSERGSP